MGEQKRKCPWRECPRNSLETSERGYCIFHARPGEKSAGTFKEALEEYVSKVRQQGLEHNFAGFVFPDRTDLREDFGTAVFSRANFFGATFEGGASFAGAEFQGDTNFLGAKFRGRTIFWDAEFVGGWVHFPMVDFEESISFQKAEFQQMAVFRWARFFRNANFKEVVFEGGVDFGQAEFLGNVSVSPARIADKAVFENATLQNTVLTPLSLSDNSVVDFTGARLGNTMMRREDVDGHILQERDEDFWRAREIYLALRNNFHTLGRYDDESWAFIKEKDMERKSFRHFRKEHKEKELGKGWIDKDMRDCFRPFLLDLSRLAIFIGGNWFPNWRSPRNTVIKLRSALSNFLEQPGVTIETGFNRMRSFVLEDAKGEAGDVSCPKLLEALWFYIKYPVKYCWSTFLKRLYGWGEWPWLIFGWCGAAIIVFSLIYLGGDIRASDGILVTSYVDRLYFSGITFTTLGFGGYSPLGGLKFWAFLESFLGIFFIALFVFSFARRTAGR